MGRGAWDSYAPEYPRHAWWTIQQADSSSISSAYSRPPQEQNLIVINTSAPPEVPGVGFYPHNSIMTEPFPQPPSSLPPFSHALPALHVSNFSTPLSSELHSTDSPINQALNPDLTTYLDTATLHTVTITNSANSGDHGQTEDDAPSRQQPLPPQVHRGPDDAGPDPGEEGSGTTTIPNNSNSATHQINATTPTNTNKKQNRADHTAAVTPLQAATQTSNTVTPEGNAPSVSSPLASSSGRTSIVTPHTAWCTPRHPTKKRQIDTSTCGRPVK